MKSSRRPSAGEAVAAVFGIALAVVGAVRLGQGRPSRTVAAQAAVIEASAAHEDSPTATSAGLGAKTGASAVSVDIADFAFNPDPLKISSGTTVTWTNRDSFAHTATADDAAVFDSGDMKTGAVFTHTFAEPGTYAYKCAIHNSMTGTVEVA